MEQDTKFEMLEADIRRCVKRMDVGLPVAGLRLDDALHLLLRHVAIVSKLENSKRFADWIIEDCRDYLGAHTRTRALDVARAAAAREVATDILRRYASAMATANAPMDFRDFFETVRIDYNLPEKVQEELHMYLC